MSYIHVLLYTLQHVVSSAVSALWGPQGYFMVIQTGNCFENINILLKVRYCLIPYSARAFPPSQNHPGCVVT